MAIDPRIPLGNVGSGGGVSVPSPMDPFSMMVKLETLRGAQEMRQQQIATAKSLEEQRRQKLDDENEIRQVMTEVGGDVDKAIPILRMRQPRVAMEFQDKVTKLRREGLDALKIQIDNTKTQLATGIQLLQGVSDQPSYDRVLPLITKMSPEIGKALGPTYDQTRVQQFLDAGLTSHDFLEQRQAGLKQFSEGKINEAVSSFFSTARSQEEWDQMLKGFKSQGIKDEILAPYGTVWSQDAVDHAFELGITPEKRAALKGKLGSFEDFVARWAKEQGKTPDAVTSADIEKLREKYRLDQRFSLSGLNDQETVKLIADAIESGNQSPDLKSLYHLAGPIKAELQRRGINHSDMLNDWVATQAFFKTQNSAKPVTFRQTIQTAYDSLDIIDNLSAKWKGGRFPVLNKGNLILAVNGAYGDEVASVAKRLEAQIKDLTSELGQVYMGGYSPTDHALKLAGENLSADWSEKVLKDMTNLARANLKVRLNSVKTAAPFASDDNPYFRAATVPANVGATLKDKGEGRYTLSDGTVWEKHGDGSIVKVK